MLQTLKNTPSHLLAAAKLPARVLVGAKYAFSQFFEHAPAELVEEIVEAIAPREASDKHLSFTFTAISLSAAIARADGQVSRAEYLAFRDSFPLSGGICGKIRQLFALACASTTPYSTHVAQIKHLFPQQKELFISLVDRLFRIAVADAPLSREEQRMLSKISQMFELTPAEYSKLHDIYCRPITPHHVLGVAKRSPRALIKKRYHALMQRYHPDKFAAHTTSPEVKLILTLKASEISQAYNAITKRAA